MKKISNKMKNKQINDNKKQAKYRLTAAQKMYLPIKRLLDIILSIWIIILLSPLFLLLSLIIKLDSPGPIFFRQKRIGKNKKPFEILKFRTMNNNAPPNIPTHMLDNPEQYITKTGKFLRKTSLDELPQAFNIFKGEMSIVGPRPALWNQEDLIAERDKYGANDIVPGLTGWAQINGRDELNISLKAKFDGEYVHKMSFIMDVMCCWKTIGAVLIHKGIVEGKPDNLKKNNISMNDTTLGITFNQMKRENNNEQKN